VSPETLLLVMHADTYNTVLRQHHYRQKQLSSATSLLSELPLFKHLNYSKIASIAYTMKSQTYSGGSLIARNDQIINNVMLIASGQVKVYAPATPLSDPSDPLQKIIEKRIPKLAVAILGRGQIIGESEVHKGERTFQMTYESYSATTEVLELPATIFKENINSAEFRSSLLYKSIEGMHEEKEQRRVNRLTRAYDTMRKMMEGPSKEEKAKDQLMNILPSILDPKISDGAILSGTTANSSNKLRKPSFIQTSNYNYEDTPKVSRRASYDPRLAKSGDKEDAIQAAIRTANQTTEKVIIGLNAPSNSIKKSSKLQSPRKLSFSANNNSNNNNGGGSQKITF
jgi:CRP-like cAMP-binding protein